MDETSNLSQVIGSLAGEPEPPERQALSDVQSAALRYRDDYGLTVIPINPKSKIPVRKKWKDNVPKTMAEVVEAFGSDENIAVICGPVSGNLVDIDIDDKDALHLAPHFLPDTGWVYGRASMPSSHWVYRCRATPPPYAKRMHESKCLVEFRSTSGQVTVLPPSVHETGEVYTSTIGKHDNPAEIAVVDGDRLLEQMNRLAAATVLLKRYPREDDCRHHIALALGGGLARLPGWDVAAAQGFLLPVIKAAGDDEAEDRLVAVADAFERLAKNEPTAGFPMLLEYIGNAATTIQKLLQGEASPEDFVEDDRQVVPIIKVRHEVAPMRQELEKHLAEEGDLYQFGGRLVRLVKSDDGQERIHEVGKATLHERASQYKWMSEKEDKDGEKEDVRVHPPRPVIEALLDAGHWKLPVLRGVTNVPTLLEDGSILSERGYHAASGLYYSPTVEFEEVPVSVTKEMAAECLKVLSAPFKDLPFATEQDKSVLLGMIFTQVLRRSIDGPVPMFLVRAPAAGTGKGLVVDAISILATGMPAPCQAWPQGHEDEVRKTLVTIVREASPLVCFDNMTGVLKSNALCSYLTSRTYGGRLLSTMTATHAPAEVVLYGTGNNIVPYGDMVRRAVCLDLDAKMHRPEGRQGFEHGDLRAFIKQNRTTLVPAVLAVVRGYQQAGKPKQPCPAVGSYEAWTSMVRQPLIWAGSGDPGQKIVDARKEGDDDEALKVAVLRCWYDEYGEKEITSSEVLTTDDGALKHALVNVMRNAELHPTTGSIVGVKPPELGSFLGSIKGCIFDVTETKEQTEKKEPEFRGLRLSRTRRSKEGTVWMVEMVDEKGNKAATAEPSPTPPAPPAPLF